MRASSAPSAPPGWRGGNYSPAPHAKRGHCGSCGHHSSPKEGGGRGGGWLATPQCPNPVVRAPLPAENGAQTRRRELGMAQGVIHPPWSASPFTASTRHLPRPPAAPRSSSPERIDGTGRPPTVPPGNGTRSGLALGGDVATRAGTVPVAWGIMRHGGDVADAKAVERAFSEASTALGPLDAVVHSAAALAYGRSKTSSFRPSPCHNLGGDGHCLTKLAGALSRQRRPRKPGPDRVAPREDRPPVHELVRHRKVGSAWPCSSSADRGTGHTGDLGQPVTPGSVDTPVYRQPEHTSA